MSSNDRSEEIRIREELSSAPVKKESNFIKKAKENPGLTIGLTSGIGVLSYMLFNLKKRNPNQKLSLYLIHTRMFVQGTIVGALTVAMGFHFYKEVIQPKYQKSSEKSD